MERVWPVQDAKARFSELLETSLAEGPQIVTKRGVETAVVIPIDQWRQLVGRAKPNLKELLLASDARTETLVPPRQRLRQRLPLSFD
ncbi:type II toxin-antitoxin system Phd/YefM family antitoxin [Candidatus Poriferisocius sp.]|uniref:type II toxin-antitoxin system Phd/YefM family antitoxin n=1 Tax=Candidatus Poriferisocius sp. TaxID=3101276 RepID=UPI003B51F955